MNFLKILSAIAMCFLVFILTNACSEVKYNASNFKNKKSMPKDSELELVFREKKAVFEKLVEMSNEDKKVVRIANDFTWLENNVQFPRDEGLGFSYERWEEYKILFKEIGIEGGITRGKSDVYLSAFTAGLLTGGKHKGYLFSKEEPVNLLTSLDDENALGKERFACKKIEESWYIYLSR